MIVQYIEKYLLNPPGRWTKKVISQDITEAEIDRVVQMTDGFSGRALSKLAIAWQAAAYGTKDAVLTKSLFFETLELQQQSLLTKEAWLDRAKSRADILTSD